MERPGECAVYPIYRHPGGNQHNNWPSEVNVVGTKRPSVEGSNPTYPVCDEPRESSWSGILSSSVDEQNRDNGENKDYQGGIRRVTGKKRAQPGSVSSLETNKSWEATGTGSRQSLTAAMHGLSGDVHGSRHLMDATNEREGDHSISGGYMRGVAELPKLTMKVMDVLQSVDAKYNGDAPFVYAEERDQYLPSFKQWAKVLEVKYVWHICNMGEGDILYDSDGRFLFRVYGLYLVIGKTIEDVQNFFSNGEPDQGKAKETLPKFDK